MEQVGKQKAKPGRKPRFSREELRERTLASAVDSVLENGVAGGVDSVRIEHVIVDADVPRAPVYELWDEEGDGTPQENLRRAAIIHFIQDLPLQNLADLQENLLEVMLQQTDELRRSTEEAQSGHREGLDAVMTETIRRITAYTIERIQTPEWRVYNALTTSIRTRDDEELLAALAEGEEQLLDRYEELFLGMGEIFQWQARAPITDRVFTVAAMAMVEGVFNRAASNKELETVMIDGKEWTIFGLGIAALIRDFCEPRPS